MLLTTPPFVPRTPQLVDFVNSSPDIRTDILVVGSRGVGPLKRALVGSDSAFVISNANAPTVVVRATAFAQGPAPAFRRAAPDFPDFSLSAHIGCPALRCSDAAPVCEFQPPSCAAPSLADERGRLRRGDSLLLRLMASVPCPRPQHPIHAAL